MNNRNKIKWGSFKFIYLYIYICIIECAKVIGLLHSHGEFLYMVATIYRIVWFPQLFSLSRKLKMLAYLRRFYKCPISAFYINASKCLENDGKFQGWNTILWYFNMPNVPPEKKGSNHFCAFLKLWWVTLIWEDWPQLKTNLVDELRFSWDMSMVVNQTK